MSALNDRSLLVTPPVSVESLHDHYHGLCADRLDFNCNRGSMEAPFVVYRGSQDELNALPDGFLESFAHDFAYSGYILQVKKADNSGKNTDGSPRKGFKLIADARKKN